MERKVEDLYKELAAIRSGQTDATAHITNLAHEQAVLLEREAKALRASLQEQGAQLLKVSQAMINLQQAIQKYAAAGTLGGAVIFYILARAAGL